MKNRKNLLIAIGSIAFVVIAYLVFEHMVYVKTDNAQIDAHALLISPKIGGFVTKVNVVEGQVVKKGDVLVQIDERDYQVSLVSAQSEQLSLEAKRVDSEKNFQRIKSLFAKGVVSNQQYDTASASYNENKAKYDAATARVDQAKLNLEYTQLIAPSDGIIARKSVEIGQLAAPGVPLVGFVGNDSRWVTANLKETEISHVKPGQSVSITVDAIPGRTYTGKVESLSAATGATFSLLPPDNATGNFTKVVQRIPVKIALEGLNQEDMSKLHAGLSALVKIKIR